MGVKTNYSLGEPAQNSTTFNLYLKTHEIKQINSILKTILLMSRTQREEWILEYGQIVQSAFDNFIDDSNLMLDSMSLDDESMELSQNLILVLQDSMELVESILNQEHKLTS